MSRAPFTLTGRADPALCCLHPAPLSMLLMMTQMNRHEEERVLAWPCDPSGWCCLSVKFELDAKAASLDQCVHRCSNVAVSPVTSEVQAIQTRKVCISQLVMTQGKEVWRQAKLQDWTIPLCSLACAKVLKKITSSQLAPR